MYTTVITWLFFGLVLVEEIVYCFLDGTVLADGTLKKYFTFKRIAKIVIISEFTIFNFLFSFSHPEYVFQIVLQILANVFALLYFFVDYFYFTQRTKSYILWLQSVAFKETKISSIFKIYSANGAKYEERRKVPQQEYSIVDAGNKRGLCILVPSRDGGFLLKPNMDMDEDILMFYAQKMEIDFEEDKDLMFCKENPPKELCKEFEYGTPSKIYLWIKNKLLSDKGKTILIFVALGIFLLIILGFLIPSQFFEIDIINDWFMKKL